MSSRILKSSSISPIMEIKFVSFQKETNAKSPELEEPKAEELLQQAEQRAADLVELAQKKIIQMHAEAQQEIEQWKREEQEKLEAEIEGIKHAGFQQGYSEGLLQAEEDYAAKISLAEEVLSEAFNEKKKIMKESEPFVIELSTNIAEKIIKKELKMNPEVLLHMIKQSLLYSNERSMITVCVSPEDFHFVQNQRVQLLEAVEGQVEVKVLPEHSIEKGGCVIRTSYGSIDARVDVQLKEIKQALLTTIQDDEDAGN